MNDQKQMQALLSELHVKAPAIVELALPLCLASRVEPALLRAMRLELTPQLDAGSESDLWFSELVGSRSADAIVFERELLHLLREQLRTRQVDAEVGVAANDPERRWLARARGVVKRIHATEPAIIQLEEELIWQVVSDAPGRSVEIEGLLRRALKAMLAGEPQGKAVARWAERALPALPAQARDTAAGRQLALGTQLRMRRSALHGEVAGELTSAAWLAPLDGRQRRQTFGVRFYEDMFEIRDGFTPGAQHIELTEADTSIAALRWTDESGAAQERTLPVRAGRYPRPADVLEFLTSSGEHYVLRTAFPRVRCHIEDRALQSAARLESQFHVPNALVSIGEALQRAAESVSMHGGQGGPWVYDVHGSDLRVHCSLVEQHGVWRIEVLDVERVERQQATSTSEVAEGSPQVFLSYSRFDESYATALLQRMRSHGLAVWLDRERIAAGQNFEDYVRAGLDASTALVALVSPASLGAEESYANAEWRTAVDRAIPIIPVAVGAVSLKGTLLERYQFANDPQKPLDQLSHSELDLELDAIAQRISQGVRERVEPQPPIPPHSPQPKQPEELFISPEAESGISALAGWPARPWVAKATRDRHCRVYDLNTGAVIYHVRGLESVVDCIAVDGDAMFVGGAGRVWVWSLARQSETGVGEAVSVAQLSVSGEPRALIVAGRRLLVGMSNGVVVMFDLDSLRVVTNFDLGLGDLHDIALHPDGHQLAIASSKAISFLNLTSGEARSNTGGGARRLRWYATDHLVLIDLSWTLWMMLVDESFRGPQAGEALYAMGYSPDGRLMLSGVSGPVAAMEVLRDGSGIVAASSTRLYTGLVSGTTTEMRELRAPIAHVLAASDGRIVAADESGGLHILRPTQRPDRIV